MQLRSSWSELLKHLISNPAERERIAKEMNVNSLTLLRWANEESKPRPHNLQRLLTVLPQEYRNQFRALLENDPSLYVLAAEDTMPAELPPALFNEVLETRADSPDLLRFWAISRQVLQHALRQLDPEALGMIITVVRCMPPTTDGKIRSLRESVGIGNTPWNSDLEPKALFLGAESLAGHVLAVGHFEQIPDLRIPGSFLPAHRTTYEVSAAACPLRYAQRVAGCLLLSCTQPEYFLPQARRTLIQSYANLLALAFEPDEFYPLDLIELALIPPLEVQRPYLAGMRQRTLSLLQAFAHTEHPLSVLEAEQQAWQQVEALLLHQVVHR